MLIVAERVNVPVFGVTAYDPVPVPVPDAIAVTQDAETEEFHAQPACVVTLIEPVPPFGGTVTRSGVTVNVQDALGCVTRKLLPAIVSVADRGDGAVLAPAAKPTLPEPLPVAPLVMVIHATGLLAVHAQPGDVVTVTRPVPAAAVIASPVDDVVKEQVTAACVAVNVCPAIVSVPVRAEVVVFAAALYVTEPLPFPVPPAVIDSQAVLLDAAQLQPAATVTVTVPGPPADGRFAETGEICGAHVAPA
jgi:hypothetical protein